MGEYKILYRLKLRFFWQCIRTDIKDWVKQRPHCTLILKWWQRGQEVMLFWTISSPFAILHADLWLLGHFTNRNGSVALMNVICDMTQFVIVVPVSNETSATLTENFIQHVLLKIWHFYLVILDDGSPFKDLFTAMCKALHTNYDILAKRSDKGLLV